MDETTFRRMVEGHDLCFAYADGAGHSEGRKSYAMIVEAAKQLPREVACRVWNGVVDSKIVPEIRREFYWTADKVSA